MNPCPIRCLILACGNTLRGDDGVGPWLAAWAAERFRDRPDVRVISRQQWTPELAEEIARAESAIFLDSSADSAPGAIQLILVKPSDNRPGLATHHFNAGQLLALAYELYGSLPRNALLLTVGAGSMELSEKFSDPVQAALTQACEMLGKMVPRLDDFIAASISAQT